MQVKADPGIQKLLKERYGVTNMALVACDPWYYGDRYGALEPLLVLYASACDALRMRTLNGALLHVMHACMHSYYRAFRLSFQCMRAAEESKHSMTGRIIQCFIYLRNGSVHDNHCEQLATDAPACHPLLVHACHPQPFM